MKNYRIIKYWTALVLFLAVSCLAADKKPKFEKFVPPAESHGAAITGYGCDRMHIADSSSTSKSSSYWNLILWAQYGTDHKKYWTKTYDTFQVPVNHSVKSAGESASTGAPIAGFETMSYDFTSLDNACADWGALVQTTLKIKPNGDKPDAAEKPKD
ncbi:MAG TPA: hypothetical protein VJW93_15720 [Candidatus Acidoferrales bacterium]|nr:hypothetical protein [Candidatus Acidoferrales bacterium]